MDNKISTYDELTTKIAKKIQALQDNKIKGDSNLESIYKNIIIQLDEIIKNVNKQRVYSPESDETKVVKEWIASNEVDILENINVLYFEFRAYCGMFQKLNVSEENFKDIINKIKSEKK